MVKQAAVQSGRGIPVETIIVGINGGGAEELTMKQDITRALVNEHKLIVRMLAVPGAERPPDVTRGIPRLPVLTSTRRFHPGTTQTGSPCRRKDILFEALVNNGSAEGQQPGGGHADGA